MTVSAARRWLTILLSMAIYLGLSTFATRPAFAVPSFARQTGLGCNTCHTMFPELTPFGRQFKLHGYTMAPKAPKDARLEQTSMPPIALMLQTSYTATNKSQPGTQNGTFALPDQLSLFYAGRIASMLGAFSQLTYDGVDDHVTMDNVDVRFKAGAAQGEQGVVYGLLLNNNPTVQDLWNSTPAWAFPYASSGSAPTPAAATQIDGTLAQQVAGLGAFVSWNQWVELDAAAYRSFQIGGAAPLGSSNGNVIQGLAPYWRLAVFHQWGNHSAELGTYGLFSRMYPGSGNPPRGRTNGFVDVAVDGQYQWLKDKHIVTVHSTLITEHQDWDAGSASGTTSNRANDLLTFRADADYFFNRMVGGVVGFFNTSGDSDRTLYAPAAVSGSRNGSPDSNGFLFEVDAMPWYNTKFSVQYTVYTKFNGSSSNYDGSGRSASDNDTLYVNAWLNF